MTAPSADLPPDQQRALGQSTTPPAQRADLPPGQQRALGQSTTPPAQLAILPPETLPAQVQGRKPPEPLPASYAELCVTSNFTFLTGASHPEELMLRAAELGLSAIAITDRNSLAGVVRAYRALKEMAEASADTVTVRSSVRIDGASRLQIGPVQQLDHGPLKALPKLIVGARLVLQDCPVEFVALPTDKAAYQRLSQLLTRGKRRAGKAECHLYLGDLLDSCLGMILIAVPPVPAAPQAPAGHQASAPQQGRADSPAKAGAAKHSADERAGLSADVLAMDGTKTRPSPSAQISFAAVLGPIQQLQRRYPGFVFVGAAPRYDGTDQLWFDRCARLALRASAPMVAVGDVLMHRASRRPLADVLTCLRHHITIDQIGTKALLNAERRLKGAPDMLRLYRRHPAAIQRTLEIASRCGFDLSQLSYDYPDEGSDGEPAQPRLERLAREGLARRSNGKIPERYQLLLDKELTLIGELGYAAYFLTVHDIVSFARSRGILCQGRGSAGNSIICWALGLTDVDPSMIGMVFERFVSRHRGEPPDIDVDFEHERREEVIQWIYQRYGRDRAGLCATVIHFRSRAAIREVGKVMGLPLDVTSALAGLVWGSAERGAEPEQLRALGLNPDDRRLAMTVALIREITGFPRHLSQHVGGFVITQGRLDALCPIENAAMEDRTCIEWDKDDIDTLKILKVDVLSLGMLTCLRKSFDLLKQHEGIEARLETIGNDDPATYQMLCRADAVGVFQVESRAQMNFLPRMLPAEFYDLVIEVAIVRPGPIQGGMVQPYIRRRQGLEKSEPFGPALEAVTKRTLGVPLFQEQALQIAMVGAGYSAEEADKLRRSLASFRRMGTIGEHREKFINGMLGNGYSRDVAERCFSQIEGFADYGFPESHAAAFALLTYVSAWLKCHHPAIFACALLNSQPMGFYAPAQIVRDARDHGIEVRPICVSHSHWDNRLERRHDGALALRLGFRQIKGFRQADAEVITAAAGNGYPDPETLWLRTGLEPSVLARLAEADAFAGMGLTRRDALWLVKAIRAPQPLPLFADPLDGEGIREPETLLPGMHLGQEVVEDYVATRLTLRAHPMELLRPSLPGLVPNAAVAEARGRIKACGLVITRQRPGTASGVTFLTLEDETGVSNVVVWKAVFEQHRREVMGGRLLCIHGRVEHQGPVTHLIAERIEDLSALLASLGHPMDHMVGLTQPQADDAPRLRPAPRSTARHPREQAKKLFPSRDFH